MTKTTVLINGKEHVTINAYLLMPDCPWAHRQTLISKIHTEYFPATKRGRNWWICLSEAELWHKRRDKSAS